MDVVSDFLRFVGLQKLSANLMFNNINAYIFWISIPVQVTQKIEQ